ncbi:MAG: hypothetical protein ACFB9N_07055 [Geitlerinemataceae cyanobacterium]
MASALRSYAIDPRSDRGVSRAPFAAAPQPGAAPRQADVTVIVRPDSASGRHLARLKNFSSIVCGTLVLAAGLAYGDRVYTELRADAAQARLDVLQRHEHQLAVSIEALKYQAAQLAEASNTGLIPQTPDRFIFVEPALPRPDRQQIAPVAAPPQFPIGY